MTPTIPSCDRSSLAKAGDGVTSTGCCPSSTELSDSAAGRLLKQIATENDATPRQVALRFLLRWPLSFVIPKSSDPDHVAENATRIFPLARFPAELLTL